MSKLTELKNLAGERNRVAVRAALEKLGPRATIATVAAEAGLNRHTAAKHLRAIRGKQPPGPKPTRPARPVGPSPAAIRERNRAAVAEACGRIGPNATIRAVMDMTGLSRVAVSKHLRVVAGDRRGERRRASEAKRVAVAEALKRLGRGTPIRVIARETGLDHASVAGHVRSVLAPETLGGATDAEIAERIAASKAERPPLIPIRKAKPVLSLAEAAVRDYRRARRSLKMGVASYSLLDSRPA